MNCLICGLQVVSNRGLSRHLLSTHKFSQEQYTLKFLLNGIQPLCKCGCGQPTKYVQKEYRFNDFIHNHHRPTLGKIMSESTKEKISQRQLSHYEKVFSTTEGKEYVNKHMEDMRKIGYEKYNVSSVFELDAVKEKIKKTNLERYGTETIGHLVADKLKLDYEKILKLCEKNNCIPLFEHKDYKNKYQQLEFQCKTHNKTFKMPIVIFKRDHIHCPSCRTTGFSMEEKEVVDFIKSIYSGEIIENSKQIISPYELDIWIPEKQLGIEYCGLYWHSSANPNFKKNLHRDKAILMQQKGYKLFLFFSDEWKNKRHLIEQMIKYRLGLIKEKIYTRKCKVKEYNKASELKEFFQNNHIDGYSNSTKGFALLYNDVVMAAMTLRTNHQGEVEICRFATNCEYVAIGAGSKLISLLPRPIITYSNNRLSNGEIYKNNGFEECTVTTSPSYYYTDFETRTWRYKCRRLNPPDKISQEDFDKYPTEYSQAINGIFSRKIFGDERPLFRIEDSAHRKWILK